MKKTTLLITGVLAACVFAGCASTGTSTATKTATKTETKKETKSTTAKKEEYVDYTPTGSWITRRVKKSAVEPTATESEEAQRAMSEAQRRGNRVPKETGG